MSALINATIAAIVYLVYIGRKPTKTDTVLDTKITWRGFGDKQPVPADKASYLLGQHPDVWVTEKEFEEGVASGKYKAPNEAPPSEPSSDAIDIDLDLIDPDSIEVGDDDDAPAENEDAVILKIQDAIIAMGGEKKPSIDAVRVALPDLSVTVKQLNRAWKELGGE